MTRRKCGEERLARDDREAGGGGCERERGETFIELVVAVTLLAIVTVGIVGSLGSLVMVSAADRASSNAEPVVRSFGDWVDRTLGATGGYRPCTPGSNANPYYGAGAGQWTSPSLGFSAPSGYVAKVLGWGPQVSAAQPMLWNGNVSGSTQFVASCPSSASGGDQGLQQLVLQVTAADGTARQTLTVQVRRP